MKYLLFLVAIFTLGLHSCSPKFPYSGEVNFLYKDAQGTIGLKSTGFGRNHFEAVMDAEKNAFKVLLFRGVPGTELNIPLIENESEVTSRNKKYFDDLFDNGKYKTFLMSSNPSSNLMKVKGTKKINVDVKINYNSLRKDLEQNQLIRRFGY